MSIFSKGYEKFKSLIVDEETGKTACVEANGGLAVNIQDQHSKAFDLYMSQSVGVTSTLTVAAAIDDYSITASASHGIVVGDQLGIYDTVSNRIYIGMVLTVATNVIGLDTAINFAFPTATSVIQRSTRELDVDGSVTRQTFAIEPPVDIDIDITRVIFQMTTTDLPELDMFGDIVGGVTRGIFLRVVNGENINLWNVKTNGEMAGLMFDLNFYDAAKQGVNGLAGRLTYAGPSKHGVTLRLAQGESLELIIQDDLTSLLSFRVIVSGHLVSDV